MKKLISLLLIVAFITMGASLAEGALVSYFSHAGENYNVGVIEEGNTAKLAKVIAEQTGAELFEIVPVVDYPSPTMNAWRSLPPSSAKAPARSTWAMLRIGSSTTLEVYHKGAVDKLTII